MHHFGWLITGKQTNKNYIKLEVTVISRISLLPEYFLTVRSAVSCTSSSDLLNKPKWNSLLHSKFLKPWQLHQLHNGVRCGKGGRGRKWVSVSLRERERAMISIDRAEQEAFPQGETRWRTAWTDPCAGSRNWVFQSDQPTDQNDTWRSKTKVQRDVLISFVNQTRLSHRDIVLAIW